MIPKIYQYFWHKPLNMKNHLSFAIAAFFLFTSFGLGQTKFKDFVWDDYGLKFSIPQFIKINSQDDFMVELESEDFLIYVEYKDDFDSLEELNEYYEVKKVININKNLKFPTYTGEISEGFIESVELGDDMDIYNVFLNIESKLNENERIAFDISIYEWNERVEQYLIKILESIHFFQIEE